jgi:DNA repair exonuclease SbcCD ATPase subunit
MEFFNLGNIITLVIIAASLVVFRLSDKRNRNLDAARNYGKQLEEKLKVELSAYIERKKADITDFGAMLRTDKESARAILANLETKTDELNKRSANIEKINEKFKVYDSALSELSKMTTRVEENLGRIQAESGFVEDVALSISGAKEKFNDLSKDIANLESTISKTSDVSVQKAVENAGKIADELFLSIKSSISDLKLNVDGVKENVESQKLAFANFIADEHKKLKSDFDAEQKIIEGVLESNKDFIDDNFSAKQEKLSEAQKELDSAVDRDKELIDSMLQDAVADIKNNIRVEQEKIDAAESERIAAVNRDKELISTMLKDAVDNAGEHAGKLEDEIYQEFKKQTEERAEKIQKYIDERILEVSNRSDDLSVSADKIKKLYDDVEEKSSHANSEFSKSLLALENGLSDKISALQERFENYKKEFDDIVSSTKDELVIAAENAKQDALSTAKEKFEEYKTLQEAQSKNIESLSLSAKQLDVELRLQLDGIIDGIRKEIARFEGESSAASSKVIEECTASMNEVKLSVLDIEKAIEKIKKDAYEKTGENLKIFEDDFSANLEKRRESIDAQFSAWREEINSKLNLITEEEENECRRLMTASSENLRKHISDVDNKFLTEAERLKNMAGAFEDSISKQMENTEESVTSLKEQIKNDFNDLKESALANLDAEIGRNAIATQDKLKNFLRDIESRQSLITEQIEKKNEEIGDLIIKSRGNIESSLSDFDGKIKDLNAGIEEIRRQSRDAIEENEAKISSLRSSLDAFNAELERRRIELFSATEQKSKEMQDLIGASEEKIQAFFNQTKLIDKTEEMKNVLQNQIEDVQSDLARLEVQKMELSNVENQFTKIKRMEDEVNAKMTRFLTEQHRIEIMEDDFKKLLATSRSVEEKLSSLTENNDTLQEMQLKFRKLSDTMIETEEKYQRIEKKNQILDATNEGIDKNFKSLQDSEKTAGQFVTTVEHLSVELTELKNAIDNLTRENSKAIETAEKLSSLDTQLSEIEKRIAEMQKARQWLADLETRMDEVNREAHSQVKLAGELIKKEGSRSFMEMGAPSASVREDVIALKRKGWTTDEISRSLKLAKGMVELILETPRDR